MSNREELLAAFAHRLSGRVPYTYTARPETERILREHLGLDEAVAVADFFACNRFSSPWSAFGGGPRLPERDERRRTGDANTSIDIWGVKREMVEVGGARYMEVTAPPLAAAESVADIEDYDWPRPSEIVLPEPPAGFDQADWKRDRVVLDMPFGPFGIPWAMRGLDNFMMDLALNPALVEAMVAKTEEYTLGYLEKVFTRYPGLVDLVGSGDDYGTQNGLMMSTDMIARYFMPSLKRHYDLAARHGAIGYHHCCGAIFTMIPLFIAAGVKVLNPIQTSAVGMDPAALKREFGRDLTFHGGIDIQQTLVVGTTAEVRAEVRQRIDTLGPEGYILCPSHTMQPDTPPANIVAMYEEVREYGAAVARNH